MYVKHLVALCHNIAVTLLLQATIENAVQTHVRRNVLLHDAVVEFFFHCKVLL